MLGFHDHHQQQPQLQDPGVGIEFVRKRYREEREADREPLQGKRAGGTEAQASSISGGASTWCYFRGNVVRVGGADQRRRRVLDADDVGSQPVRAGLGGQEWPRLGFGGTARASPRSGGSQPKNSKLVVSIIGPWAIEQLS